MKNSLKKAGIILLSILLFGGLGWLCYKLYQSGDIMYTDGERQNDDTARMLMAFGMAGGMLSFLGIMLTICYVIELYIARVKLLCRAT